MKSVFIASIMVLALMASVMACGGGTVSPQCEALKIAREHLPAGFADTSAIVTLDVDAENNEIWRVMFPLVEVPFSELGWEGDASQYFKPPSDKASYPHLPEGVYLNVVIYIDAETGEVAGRELNNDIILGYPDMYAKCD